MCIQPGMLLARSSCKHGAELARCQCIVSVLWFARAACQGLALTRLNGRADAPEQVNDHLASGGTGGGGMLYLEAEKCAVISWTRVDRGQGGIFIRS